MSEFAPPATPAEAAVVFGERLDQAEHFVRILADTGISRGLIGPREAPRLWDRHVLNCAVVHVLIPPAGESQQVVDVGSGAGLPGLALAIARPDLELHLVEPLARRTAWLAEATAELGLSNVTVHTARAEAMWDQLRVPWVTARAVTGIARLAEWTLPLLSGGGSLLALKGSKARDELKDNHEALERLGVTDAAIEEVGGDVLAEPTTVLRLTVAEAVDRRIFQKRSPSSAGSARRRSDRPRRSGGAAAPAGGRGGGAQQPHEPGEGLVDAGDRGRPTNRAVTRSDEGGDRPARARRRAALGGPVGGAGAGGTPVEREQPRGRGAGADGPSTTDA